MSWDPTLFPTPMYETANEALLFCRNYLEQNGHADAASHLKGFDAINTASMARLALQALRAVRPVMRGEALEYVDIAINAMERAVSDVPLRAVA